jgi:hypothetical protein
MALPGPECYHAGANPLWYREEVSCDLRSLIGLRN